MPEVEPGMAARADLERPSETITEPWNHLAWKSPTINPAPPLNHIYTAFKSLVIPPLLWAACANA